MRPRYADLILTALRRRPERTAFRFTGDDGTTPPGSPRPAGSSAPYSASTTARPRPPTH
ncbi:hypothetical protein [Kitasatospora sp. NPDC094016]|uniref:hypothetical protein n=1 Tax=Kitasatospora sp. NPDC094016 TaxID=3154986 RepID=UPI00332D871F